MAERVEGSFFAFNSALCSSAPGRLRGVEVDLLVPSQVRSQRTAVFKGEEGSLCIAMAFSRLHVSFQRGKGSSAGRDEQQAAKAKSRGR